MLLKRKFVEVRENLLRYVELLIFNASYGINHAGDIQAGDILSVRR